MIIICHHPYGVVSRYIDLLVLSYLTKYTLNESEAWNEEKNNMFNKIRSPLIECPFRCMKELEVRNLSANRNSEIIRQNAKRNEMLL